MVLEFGVGEDSASYGHLHFTQDQACFFPITECLFQTLKIHRVSVYDKTHYNKKIIIIKKRKKENKKKKQSRDKEIDRNVVSFCLPALNWSTKVSNLAVLCQMAFLL